MEYKPNNEDIIFAKKIYDDVIFQQVYNPLAIKEAFKKLFGYEALNTNVARRMVASWFQYQFKPSMIDTTETSLPSESETLSVNNDSQTHNESFPQNGKLEDLGDEPIITDKALEEALGKVKNKRRRKSKKDGNK